MGKTFLDYHCIDVKHKQLATFCAAFHLNELSNNFASCNIGPDMATVHTYIHVSTKVSYHQLNTKFYSKYYLESSSEHCKHTMSASELTL